ncbi:MBL fold metallo-hydrolase [Dactylosporangium maewongense]|uniref:MBL fold metallo-hydrolase n=2 Tax=Micromonosporaceae TaxID=28056 RepID=A0ABN2BE69_9ACTN
MGGPLWAPAPGRAYGPGMDLVELLPERLYQFAFPVGHAYLWRGPDGLTIVDTGLPGSAPLIAAAVESLGLDRRDVRNLLLTHAHPDHTGAAADIAAWGDVTVHAHAGDAEAVRGRAAVPPPVLDGWERDLYEQVHATLPDAPAPPARVDRELRDGDVVDLGGGVTATAVEVPGHTPGSVAFHLPGPGVLFTGDTIARTPDGAVIPGVFNADPGRVAESFRRQAALRPATVCFGHGAPLTDQAARLLTDAASR